MEMPLHLKYRPSTFDEVIGQTSQIESLKAMLRSKTAPTTFLLTGDSGIGKTTLARIIAKHYDYNVIEIDVASQNSAEHARSLVDDLEAASLFDEKGKFIILDEVHVASKVFFNVLLKTLEEPMPMVAFALCTTEKSKIPSTVLTRCTQINLNPVPVNVIKDYLDKISGLEKYSLPKGVTHEIANSSKGSVRQALVYLSSCRAVKSVEEVSLFLENECDKDEVFSMVRAVANRGNIVNILASIKKFQEESVSCVQAQAILSSYFYKMLLGSKSEKDIYRLANVLDIINSPVYEWKELTVKIIKIMELNKH